MDNFNLLRQTIRFQRNALQNSLAMISAVQQHGEGFLKSTLEHTPWVPGEGKDACLFWAGIWRKNLTGVSELVDKNLALMERFTTGEKREGRAEKPAAETTGQAQHAAEETAPDRKTGSDKHGKHEEEQSGTATRSALVAAETERALVPEPEKKGEQQPGKKSSSKKKPTEPT